MPGALALDLSTRNCGWAAERHGANRPAFGLVKLPGLKDLGLLYGSVRNALEMLIERHRPTRMLWCMAQFADMQTTARALQGVTAIAELVCYDHEIEALMAIEPKVRKAVLGRGSFGGKDASGKLIPGLGRIQAKAAVARWCHEQGYADLPSDDVGDAIVLLAYDKMLREGKIPR